MRLTVKIYANVDEEGNVDIMSLDFYAPENEVSLAPWDFEQDDTTTVKELLVEGRKILLDKDE